MRSVTNILMHIIHKTPCIGIVKPVKCVEEHGTGAKWQTTYLYVFNVHICEINT